MQKSFGTNFRFKKNKPLYLCSFCRPPDNSTTPMDVLNNSLSELGSNEPTTLSQIILGSEGFNFHWKPVMVTYNLAKHTLYGITTTQLFFDSINEHGLEQLVNIPTHNNNILDLLFTPHPYLIANVQTIPGISDHEAVSYQLNIC